MLYKEQGANAQKQCTDDVQLTDIFSIEKQFTIKNW